MQSMQVRFSIGSPAKPIILVPTVVNGKGPYQFALDTGASYSVCSTGLARELGLEAGERREATGAGGSVAVALSRIASLAVGSARVDSLPVAIADLDPVGRAAGVKLDGIIGYNYLKHFTVTIDYRTTTLRLTPAE